MCDPVTLGVASFAMGAATSVASYMGQSQQAKATEQAAREARRNDQNQITLRQTQENDALRQKESLQNIEEAERKADATASAAASGISGISLDNILNDVSRKAARNRQTEQLNTQAIVQQLQQQRKGVNATAQSRINSSPKPSAIGLVAGIGSSAISGYGTYNKYM